MGQVSRDNHSIDPNTQIFYETSQVTNNKSTNDDYIDLFTSHVIHSSITSDAEPIQNQHTVSHVAIEDLEDKPFEFANTKEMKEYPVDQSKFMKKELCDSSDIKLKISKKDVLIKQKVSQLEALKKVSHSIKQELKDLRIVQKNDNGEFEEIAHPNQPEKFADAFNKKLGLLVCIKDGVIKFEQKPNTSTVRIKNEDGTVLVLKTGQMSLKEKERYEAKIAEYIVLEGQIETLKAEISDLKDRQNEQQQELRDALQREALNPKERSKKAATKHVNQRPHKMYFERKSRKIQKSIDELMLRKMRTRELRREEIDQESLDSKDRILRKEIQKEELKKERLHKEQIRR